jgi:putative ABC transport system ATP-binding protein
LYSWLGLLKPSSGKIYVKGKEYGSFSEKEKNIRTSQLFGMVFQQYNLLFSLNVFDNVALPQILISRPSHERKPKVMALLKRFGIEARAHQSPAMLSGGQQQRVAVCRALINDPDIILADEPVGNLDSESARIVMETLKDINVKDKKTVILVTHDARYLPYADRVYFFKDAGIDHEERMSGKGPEGDMKQMTKAAGDLDRLARVHASLTPAELRAWSVSNWLTDELTIEQEQRMKKLLEELLAGKISPHMLFEGLDRPFSDGGVGLYRQTAVLYAKKIMRLLNETRLFADRLKHKDDPVKRARLVRMLRAFLLEEHKGDISKEKLDHLGKAIEERVLGTLNHDEFIAALVKKLHGHQGIGLTEIAIQRLAERLDLIMSRN